MQGKLIIQYSLMDYTHTSENIVPASTKHANCNWQTVIIMITMVSKG